ncbi:MAG: hypothetical protein R8K46_10820 [Mariprofundaceae bacterium]
MNKLIGVLILLIGSSAFAGPATYSIEGKMKAVFPGPPEFESESGSRDSTWARTFSFTDTEQLLIYTASYTRGKQITVSKNTSKLVESFISGQARSVNGIITNQKINQVNSNYIGHYIIEFEYNGIPVKKHSAVIYRNGYFYTWAIQDILSSVSKRGLESFNQYVENFTVQ